MEIEFSIGNRVVINCPSWSAYREWNGTECDIIAIRSDGWVKLRGADNTWWPTSYIRHVVETIPLSDIADIMW